VENFLFNFSDHTGTLSPIIYDNEHMAVENDVSFFVEVDSMEVDHFSLSPFSVDHSIRTGQGSQ
jgi:hypothetical protein